MNRLAVTFLAFLLLATASAGAGYQNAQSLVGSSGSPLNAIALVICAIVFGFAMIVLARIIRLTSLWEK